MVSLLSQVFESSKKGRLWWMEVFLYQDCEALPYQYGNLKGHSGQVANVSTPKSKRTLRKWSHLLVGNYPHGYHATKYFAVRPLVNYCGWILWMSKLLILHLMCSWVPISTSQKVFSFEKTQEVNETSSSVCFATVDSETSEDLPSRFYWMISIILQSRD